MAKKWKKELNNIRCDVCGYCNHKEYVQYSGVCHGCGNVLDERAFFKQQMNKKLRLWRNDKYKDWGYKKDRY